MEVRLVQNLQLFYKSVLVGFVSILLLTSCGNTPDEERITGGADAEILNLQDSTVHLYSEVLPLDYIKGKQPIFDEYIDVDSNGIFIYPYVFSEGYYFLEWDGNKVKYFIREGKRLSVDFDAKQPTKKPDFSGKMKYESRYLFDKHLVLAKFESNLRFHYSLSETDFLDVLNLLRSKLDKMLVLYITNRPMGSEYFMKQESLSNLFYMASIIEKYKMKHEGNASDTLMELTQNLSLNDTNAIENTDYFNFITAKIWAASGYPISDKSVYQQIELVDSVLVRDGYKNYVLFQTTREVAKWEKSDVRTEVIDTLLYAITDNEVKSFLKQNLQQDTLEVVINDRLNSLPK